MVELIAVDSAGEEEPEVVLELEWDIVHEQSGCLLHQGGQARPLVLVHGHEVVRKNRESVANKPA